MKSFIEEYGVIIVAVLVILAFVAFAPTLTGQLTDAVTDTISHFIKASGVTTT